MFPLVTSSEMREFDRRLIEGGTSGIELMRRAGLAVFEKILSIVGDLQHQKILILCGKGNNGGDGCVIAQKFLEYGIVPEVIMVGRKEEIRSDARFFIDELANKGFHPTFAEDLIHPRANPTIIVDARLGTGTSGELQGSLYEWVLWVNQQRSATVFSVDIPSGLNGDDGSASTAIEADYTVTIGFGKRGLLLGEGKKYSGEILRVNIGFPEDWGGSSFYIEASDVLNLLPERPTHSHKYDYGKVLVLAGSRGMSGAALLAARACLRSGAGLVRVALPKSIAHVIETALPEAMSVHLPETRDGSISKRALKILQQQMEWADVLAIGPGLSQHPETMAVTQSLLKNCKKPVVIDADALLAVKNILSDLKKLKVDFILTPHSGELARLINSADGSIDFLGGLKRFYSKISKTVLLKGMPTKIYDGIRCYFTPTGNPGMATAGSGDVLTGIIAGLMAQGLTSVQAGYAGAYLHGLAGDIGARKKSPMGLIAGDLVDNLPHAILHLQRAV